MPGTTKSKVSPTWLGIEGGATHTVGLGVDAAGRLLWRHEAGPGNVRLLDNAALMRLLREFARRAKRPAAIGLGMAGALTAADRDRVAAAVAHCWPGVPCQVTHDLDTALMAAQDAAFPPARPAAARSWAASRRSRPVVLVQSGTGSFCYGWVPPGRPVKVGGWGHLLGDRSSGYDLALQGLRAVMATCDRSGEWPPLGSAILAALHLNEPSDLVGWAQSAPKHELAALVVPICAAWRSGDSLARKIVTRTAQCLVEDATACARRLVGRRRAVDFVLAGSVLLKEPKLAALVRRQLRTLFPESKVRSLSRESAWGAVELAGRVADRLVDTLPAAGDEPNPSRSEADLESLAASPTERRNPRSMRLDRLPLGAAVDLMIAEERHIPAALRRVRRPIARAVQAVAQAFRRGGRLFYVGAGTSGRLGVLDASECPPTFRTPPEMVQAIMAGGAPAVWRSVEGAEDDRSAGERAVQSRKVAARDVVVGIAASGRTPFVLGALASARRRRAFTVLLTCNPRPILATVDEPNLRIAMDVGPEVLTGSTRLKAGTATKVVLNMLTTLAMVRCGKVVSNLMVDVDPSNVKLRDRAARIVTELAGGTVEEARAALDAVGWRVPAAIRRARSRRLAV